MKPKSPKPIRGYGYVNSEGALVAAIGWTRQQAQENLTGIRGYHARHVWIDTYKPRGYKPVRVTLSLSLDAK